MSVDLENSNCPQIGSQPVENGNSNKFNRRQWLLFGIFICTHFLGGMVYNMKGPFYPQEAESKGVTATQYGFVFGIFELTKFLVSPLFGKYLNQLGARRLFLVSLYVIGTCSVLFGLLNKLENATVFLVSSLVLRVVEALGSSGYSLALFSLIASEFQGSVATTFAILEACFGVGLFTAPPLGGILFQLAGYSVPFITVGVLIFTSATVISLIMPRGFTTRDHDGKATEGFGVFKVLAIKGVLFIAIGVFLCACSAGFINATLAQHLKQFQLSPFQTGVVFAIFGVVYTILNPVWGWVCDKSNKPMWLIIIGAVANLAAFAIIGPAPFFEFDPRLWVVCIALVLHGIALGAIFVSTFVIAPTFAIASGMPKDLNTHAVVSGMWTSILSLGMFTGPSVGGVLLDTVGFRWGTVFLIGMMLFLVVLVITFQVNQASYTESRNLLQESNPLIFQSPSADTSISMLEECTKLQNGSGQYETRE